ncbi:MAG: dTDP-4-dehydrorhamnose 3,5-epimerase [Bacteroidetes bacterium HGW-Bacteroidetes-23]|nr:MAG: dTDP-4-dehydrorhamnose 3,5-epimerase [Bacteroidetes bacterium HGW-Bacteroidetes-23]
MKFIETKLKGCFVIEPKIIKDERGYFMESFNERTFQNAIEQSVHFVQDNQSFSSRGVLRGLHYQTGEFAQAKLVRVIQGEVLDVAVDIRPGSATFGQYEAVILSAENQKQFFVPRGFAHGFLVLSESADFLYKTTDYYSPEFERSIIWNDPDIAIKWPYDGDLSLSKKDKDAQFFRDAEVFTSS